MRLSSLTCILAFALASVLSWGQAAAPADYVLGVDDVITVSVLSHDGMDKDLTVLQNGTVSYPFLPSAIQASGRKTDELAADIKTALEKTLNNVVVTVTVKEVHSRKVKVVGSVTKPGVYDLKPSWRLLDVVAMAGGLSARPAAVSGRVIHSDGTLASFDMVKATLEPESDANPLLRMNDMVLLDERDPAMNKVFVNGEVNKPGAYDIGENGTNVVAILAQAGNPTDNAAVTRALVLRGSEVIPINLEPAVLHGQMPDELRNFQLRAGDTLLIPKIEQRIAVMGQVNKPGNYPLPESKSLTVLDALSLAGGQDNTGDLGKAGLIRVVQGKATVIPIDLNRMLTKKQLDANVAMQPGDVLYIPTKGEKQAFDWRNVLGPLNLLSVFGIKW